MRYLVILGDGMADRPVPELGGRTPLEAAHKPHMDWLAQHGEVGMARTVPEGMPPGSDTANLSVMGYDPRTCYSGRSPLEAVSMGIPLAEDDVTFRCNLGVLPADPRPEPGVPHRKPGPVPGDQLPPLPGAPPRQNRQPLHPAP